MRKILSLLMALLLVLALLAGCSSNENTRVSTSTEEPWSLPAGGKDEGLRSASSIKSIPQMAELHLDVALNTTVWNDFDFLTKVQQRGLQHPYTGVPYREPEPTTHGPYNLYNYIWGLNLLLQETDSSKNYFGLSHQTIQKMTADAFADPVVVEAALNMFVFQYDEYEGAYWQVYLDDYGNDLQFNLYWQEANDIRTVVLTNMTYYQDPPSKNTYVLEYQKGSDGVWRLYGGQVIEPKAAAPGVKDAIIMPIAGLSRQIIGSLGESVLSLDDWNHTVTIKTLDWEFFTEKNQVVIEGKLLNYHIRDGKLYLLFDDRAVLLDESLSIVGEKELPKPLYDVIHREDVYVDYTEKYDGGEWHGYYVSTIFGGYDVTGDLETFAYSTEEGLYLLDGKTGNSTLLWEAEMTWVPGYPYYIDTPRLPAFAAGEQQLWATMYNYEYSPDYFSYSIQSKKGEWLAYDDVLGYLRHPAGGMGEYFSSGGYDGSGSLFTGENHYVAFGWSASYTRVILAGKLTDTTFPARQLNYPIDYTGYVVALLSDGRIIFEHEGFYYCTLAY